MDINENLKGVSGIYMLLINEVKYIGSSLNIKHRLQTHLRHLRSNSHINKHMQNYFNKYGEDCLTYHIIERCPVEDLLDREFYYMEHFDTFTNGFNQTKCSYSPLGYKHTEESRKIMSEKKKGVKQSRSVVEKRAKSQRGKIRTEESRRRLSQSKLGEKNPMYGKRYTEEEKSEKVAKLLSVERWNKGKTKDSCEIMKKLSEKLKGRVPHNKTPHRLVDTTTGEEWESESLTQLGKITPISYSTLLRLKGNSAGVVVTNRYKVEVINYE